MKGRKDADAGADAEGSQHVGVIGSDVRRSQQHLSGVRRSREASSFSLRCKRRAAPDDEGLDERARSTMTNTRRTKMTRRKRGISFLLATLGGACLLNGCGAEPEAEDVAAVQCP